MRQRFVVEIVDDEPASTSDASVNTQTPEGHGLPEPDSGAFRAPESPFEPPLQDVQSVPVSQPVEQPVSRYQESVPSSVPQAPTASNRTHVPVSPPSEPNPRPPVVAQPPSMQFVKRAQQNHDRAKAPDIFEQRQSHVQGLFQEAQLNDAREEHPHVEQPAVTRRRQREILRSTREQAFQEQLQNTTVPKTKIEQFYQSQPDYAPTQPASPRKQNSWKQSILRSLRIGRRVTVGMVLILVLVGSVAGAAFAVRADLHDTKVQVQGLVSDMETGQIRSAKERVEILRRKQARYTTVYRWSRGVLPVVLGEQKTTHLDKLLSISDSGLYVIENGFETYDLMQTGYQQFLGEDSGDAITTLTQVSGELEAVFTDLSSLQAELQGLDNPFGIAVLDEVRREVSSSFPELRRAVLAAQQMSYALPELLGEDGKKQYLVLLQNNEELRPTGGFIGSFAILTVEKGRFVDFRVEDVYEADGQLQGYVTPPEEIVQYLGEAQWYLRDVNWDPDFPTVADQAGWFLNKEINIQPDGVIGINLHVAQKLLEVTGPVQLVDYDEVITKDNLYERAEMHSEINFFPGSTQKRDFLSAVANQLFDKLMNSEDTNTLAVMEALYESAEESQLLVSVDAPQARTAFQNLGWTGAVLSPNCPSPFNEDVCFVDTVMQVEANVGVNKANQYIEREIAHHTIVGKEQVKHERSMTFTNTADSNAWPEGAYKNYLRLFVPANASLNTVTIDGTVLDASAVRVIDEGDKESFGFLVNVPIRSTVTVEVEYTVPVPADQRQVYALFEQKQSGTADDEVVHTVEVLGRSVLTVAPEPVIEGRTMEFVSDRTTHQFMAVEME
ncbi:DUF4012 domain-containing protein [Candidatus Woesebacteria bacterium]|nr:DUF4012 domain-containing protein [Candidatus Woesebacteria bacterium]MCD8507015.1 DUF4012 domain-containing protein [Candidatus Woesebacteria bacterium]MCD8527306.1 DUF4012 domain-containing protein [Candidatus Woesebacteria bacterium]MCD8546671.1 DUF4012 domain-containing protein [Candidatus Woesebacteria bacterium]